MTEELGSGASDNGGRLPWLRAHVAFALVVIALIAAYRESIVSLVSVWAHSGTFQYAFLIFPISAFLVWTRRSALRGVTPHFSSLGVAALGAISVIWLLGALAGAAVAQHFSVVAAVPLAVLTCYGRAVVWPLAFPLGYLFFAVPFGNFLVEPLQDFTAAFSVWALQLSGATVLLEGRLIYMPAGTFEVAEACSGIRFFIASTALGTLYAYLFYQSWSRRLLFVLASMVAPILANGLRVYFTIMMGQHLGMEYATGLDHLVFGWQFFGTVLLLLFVAGWFWREPPEDFASAPAAGRTAGDGTGRALICTVVGVMLLVLGPVLAAATAGTPYVPGPARTLPAAALVGSGWQVSARGGNVLGARFELADAVLEAAYVADGPPVAVYAARYVGQPAGRHDVLTYGNRVYASDAWTWLGDAGRDVAGLTVNEVRLDGIIQDRIAWYWYMVDGRAVAAPTRAKLLQAWSRLTGTETRSAVVVLSTAVAPGQAAVARQRLARFLEARGSALHALVAGRGGQ